MLDYSKLDNYAMLSIIDNVKAEKRGDSNETGDQN
jgi:hypothetical protein